MIDHGLGFSVDLLPYEGDLVGYRAKPHTGVIDLDRIKLGKPWLAFDLPAGGKRLLQKADGYDCTIKNGVVTFRNGDWTGATPGGLIRGPQQVEMREAAE